MKTVMAYVPAEVLAWRKHTGADRFDEMWDGVLHMAPAPNRDHQKLEYQLERALDDVWASDTGGEVFHQRNVARAGAWPNDYRVPDLVLLRPDRSALDRNEYFDGGPNVAIEIASPGDETYDKLGFYAEVDVREVWIVDRDTRRVEVRRLGPSGYELVAGSEQGWIPSVETGLEVRSCDGVLELRRHGDPTTARQI